jgi:hypothetical protein
MSQTMLMAKRLTTFLSQNTTPHLPTLILLSPTGKLLSSSSPLPTSTLRTQATLACSLWTLYQPGASSLISASLPRTSNNIRGSDSTLSSTTTAAENDLSTITIQLSHGIMVIRALTCGLLFVAIGPLNASSTSSPHPSSHTLTAQGSSHSYTSPPSSPPAHEGYEGVHERERDSSGSLVGIRSSAPSEAGSVGSTGTRTGSIMGVKRQADEVGRFLDAQLEGFVLSLGGEGR